MLDNSRVANENYLQHATPILNQPLSSLKELSFIAVTRVSVNWDDCAKHPTRLSNNRYSSNIIKQPKIWLKGDTSLFYIMNNIIKTCSAK